MEEELKPILIAQFVFHPQTGTITGNFADNLSISDFLQIKNIAEEKLTSLQLELHEATIKAIEDINFATNKITHDTKYLKEINEKINAVLQANKILLEGLKINES